MRTSGPWECAHGKDGGFHIFANMNDTGTEACIASRNEWPYHKSESKANGDLIAAAPELLEALELLAGDFLERNDPKDWMPGERIAIEKALKAIAKAKGESA